MTALLHRTSSDLASMSRAAQRKQRLLEIEKEQRLEDAEALKMTEEQRQILLRSFTSVKVEFSDLDGLKWTHSALRKRMHDRHPSHHLHPLHPPHHHPSPISPSSPSLSSPDQHTFVILTNADLASFNSEDTIRASRSRPRSSPSPLQHPHSHMHPHKPISTKSRRVHRSPVRNLFPQPEPPSCEWSGDADVDPGDDADVEEGHGHAKRRRRSDSVACPLPDPIPTPSPTPTQASFNISKPPSSSSCSVSSPSSCSSSSSVPRSPSLHIIADLDELPSPTSPTIPISKCRRVYSSPRSSSSSNSSPEFVPGDSRSNCPSYESGFPPGLGEPTSAMSVRGWTPAPTPTCTSTTTAALPLAATSEVPQIPISPRATLFVDCTFLPRSTPDIDLPSDNCRSADNWGGERDGDGGGDGDGEGDGDGSIVPSTPRPRDFAREELSESA